MFNLETLKTKYKHVRFDLIGIFIVFIGLIIIYYGYIMYYGSVDYLGEITNIFSSAGTGIYDYHMKKNISKGKTLMITGGVTCGLGVFMYILYKKINH